MSLCHGLISTINTVQGTFSSLLPLLTLLSEASGSLLVLGPLVILQPSFEELAKIKGSDHILDHSGVYVDIMKVKR